jgi:hypothetical protein
MSAIFDFVNGPLGRFAIKQGEGVTRELFWKNDADDTPVDLTGFTAKMQARKTADTDAVLTLTTENGGIVLGGTTGKITLVFDDAATAVISAGFYLYDLFLLFNDNPTCFLEGRIEITRRVTQ